MERQKRYSQQIFRQPGTGKAAADGLEKISEIESGIRNEKISHECNPARIYVGTTACRIGYVQLSLARAHRHRRYYKRHLVSACLSQIQEGLVVRT